MTTALLHPAPTVFLAPRARQQFRNAPASPLVCAAPTSIPVLRRPRASTHFLPVESRAQRTAAVAIRSCAARVAAPSANSGTRWGSLSVLRATDGDGDVASTNSESSGFDIRRVEQYTERVPGEVVVLNALVDGEEDEVVVFRGFSSSLVLPTASDPSDPVLPASAAISSVDRVRGPFNPARMEYIQQGMRWEEFDQLLEAMHL
ncbi:unnamed protein product [Closterium sp. Yama58-4]|nr:unnamed protein product [Closterium sp. Yama58-4]